MGICGSKPPLDVNAKGQLVGDPDLATLKRLKSKVKQLQKATKKAAAKLHPDGAGASKEAASPEMLTGLSIKELRALAGSHSVDLTGCVEKGDLVNALVAAHVPAPPSAASAGGDAVPSRTDLAFDLQALKLFEALVPIKQELHDLPKPSAKDYLLEPTTAIVEMRKLVERLRSLQDRATEKNVYAKKERESIGGRLALVERCVTAKEEMLEAAQREYTAQQTVPALRAHARGLDSVVQAALMRNEDVMTTLKLTRWETVKKSTRSYDRRENYVQRTPEMPRLLRVISAVRLHVRFYQTTFPG